MSTGGAEIFLMRKILIERKSEGMKNRRNKPADELMNKQTKKPAIEKNRRMNE
jgi:hypothetical protein